MNKEVIYNNKICKRCKENYITTTTVCKSQQGTLYIGDTGNCDTRIANLCNSCKEQVLKKIFNIY